VLNGCTDERHTTDETGKAASIDPLRIFDHSAVLIDYEVVEILIVCTRPQGMGDLPVHNRQPTAVFDTVNDRWRFDVKVVTLDFYGKSLLA